MTYLELLDLIQGYASSDQTKFEFTINKYDGTVLSTRDNSPELSVDTREDGSVELVFII